MKIATYAWVFLTRSGIGLKGFRLIEETIHQYQGKRNHFWNYAVFQFLFRKKIKLRGKYFIIHNHWCPGYFHWITEALPRLFHVRTFLDHHILLLPESFKAMPLFDSIEPLYDKDVYWIPMKKNMVLETLMIPESPPFSGVYEKGVFFALRSLYSEAVRKKNINLKLGNRIYASRSKALRRKVTNESEVTAILLDCGFTIVHFDDHSFWEQVAIMQGAEVLVSAHGAGLSNLLFMREGSRVVELQKEPGGMGAEDILYRDFSKVMMVNYDVLFCKPVNSNEALYHSDIIVDLQSLKDMLTFYGYQV